jgi:hypothetical protein
MSEEAQKIAELEAELARLKALAKAAAAPLPLAEKAPDAVTVDEFGIPLNLRVPIEVVTGDVRWRPAKKPLHLRDPERAIWGRSSRRGPRIG